MEVKLKLVQLNTKVGAFEANLKKISESLAKASEDELVVFSECVLGGYPAFDLWLEPNFVEQSEASLKEILKRHPKSSFVIGGVARASHLLFNQAIFASSGKVLARYSKQLLPTYDVFDEARYFEPGRESCTVSWKGKKILLTICEDAWAGSSDSRIQGRYANDPLEASRDADLVVNLSASPFEKTKDRFGLFSSLAKKWKRPFIHVNAVGGNDSLIFDGGSFAVDASGACIGSLARFKEDCLSLDLEHPQIQAKAFEARASTAEIYDALVLGLKDFCHKQNVKSVVLGLSGGIDSALVACLAEDALGADKVRLVLMPSRYTSAESNIDAVEIAKAMQSPLHILSIEALFPAALYTLQTSFEGLAEDVTEENLQSRIRGMLLMALSNKFGDFVLATGNKSELATGYCTLYGDMCGGLAPIGDVLKTEVYDLSREANRRKNRIPERVFTKAPSAELRANQKDQDSLPPYEILDRALQLILEGSKTAKEVEALGIDSKTTDWIIKKLSQTEFKRFQAAPVLKISAKAFGIGRRFPIVHQIH